jgi:mannose/cellobiose epimerase-like protein (N-acyl-D-glucosamine 2-epimerase family)
MRHDHPIRRQHHAVEWLESRQLLSFTPDGWTNLQLGSGPGIYIDDTALPDGPSATAFRGAVSAALDATDLNASALRTGLVSFVDLWNGGQQGRNGTGGMGVYAANWDGLFRANLDRQFQPYVNTYTNDMTVIAQAREIYINVEAYRAAPTADRARFLNAVQRGADYLLGKSVDPNTYNGKPGGLWWGLQPDGVSPPTHTTPIGGTQPRYKDAYGQVQSLFALAQAYSITGDVDHLNGAFKQLDVWNGQFADTAAGAGAFLPTANENYTQRVGNRNLDYMTHAFEALLTLNQVTPASDPRKAGLSAQITNMGNFITTRMYRDAAGSTTMGYLPWWYDAQWNPSTTTGQQYSTPGHNFEVAYLLSRAVEQGFSAAWLNTADKLLAYTLRYGFDNVATSPTYGAVLPEEMKFDGSRLDPTPNNLVWWQESEAARALLHFAIVRGRTDLLDEYNAASAFIQNHFIDPTYGGWYQYLSPTTLQPTTTDKGTVWTGGYHETMLDAERIRVAELTNVTLPAAADAYVRDGTYATTNYGNTTDLNVKKHSAAGYSRESYLRFSLTGVGSIDSATLRLFGSSTSATQNVGVGLYAVSNTSWGETSLNWSNKPTSSGTPIATKTISGTTGTWYTFDATSYLKQQMAAGATAVTFVLKGLAQTDQLAVFNSDENGSNKPQLVVAQQAVSSQALVVSAGNVTVPEGNTGNFTVQLAAAPTGNVTVNIARTSGDTDVTVQSGASLVFTPTNWNTAQTVTLAAAQDADTINGSAVFTVSSSGLTSKTVTATESDDDPVIGPITVRAAADATVRDGTYAATNFGTTADLTIKKNAALGYNRESYLRFSLSGVSSVGSAILRLYGNLQEANAGGLDLQVYGVNDVSWSETGINWNKRPAASTGVLATKNVPDSTKRWYEIDLTSYLQQRKAAGATAVTLLLRNATNSNAVTTFASDEATANQPQLVITPAVAGPVGVVVDTPSLAVPEGFSSSFDIRLASAPASNVVVTIAKQSGGDADLNANKTSLTFTPANWNVNQSVTVNATDDNTDTISGSALFVVTPAGGGTPFTVVASEIENDGKGGANVLAPVDDAYVRDGAYADTNFGGTNDIVVKRSSGPGYTREGYLTFDLSNDDTIVGGRLRLYGRLTATTNPSLVTQIFPATTGASWSQSTLTWNNRPAAGTWPLGSVTVTGTTARWYEIDVTSYLQAEKAAGRNRVTFVLRNMTDSDAMTSFASFETQGNWPELVIVRNYPSDTDTRLMRAIDVADQQLRSTLSQLGTDATKYVYVTQGDGNWTVVNADTWTSGMLPASLWYMAKETGDPYWTTEAIRRTLPLQGQKTQKDDLAFRLAYAYWPLYAATNNAAYRQVLIDAAASKVAMYNGTVHAFLSPGRASTSGNPDANFGVLTDQITDVELVLWAAQQTNNTDWYNKAVDHLHTMAQYSVRADGSTYQWIYFNSKNGAFVGGEGYQGYSATSTWSRGQAWAIYGFTAAYRLTGQPEFLAAAKTVSDWYLNHLPTGDMVPYWDFNAPDIPNTYKDSSAAAVAADGMAQLATLDTNPTDAAKYRKAAGDTLAELASPTYLNENWDGAGGSRGILLHGAWFVPDPIHNGDASTIWGDYFFLEAINKYMGSKTNP